MAINHTVKGRVLEPIHITTMNWRHGGQRDGSPPGKPANLAEAHLTRSTRWKRNSMNRQITRILSVMLTSISFAAAPVQHSFALTLDDTSTTESTLKKLHENCSKAGFLAAIASCLLDEEKRFGVELERTYKDALKAAGNTAHLLRQSQRDWLKYQTSACHFAQERIIREGLGPSRLSYSMCLIETTLNRLKTLKEAIQ